MFSVVAMLRGLLDVQRSDIRKKNRIIHTFGVNEIEWKVQLVFIEQQVMPYQMKFNEIEH